LRGEGLIRYIGFTSEDTNDSVYRLIRSGRFDAMQMCYNFIYQHPYEPSRPFGSILEADRAEMGVVTMRSMTSGTLQNWIQMVNPEIPLITIRRCCSLCCQIHWWMWRWWECAMWRLRRI